MNDPFVPFYQTKTLPDPRQYRESSIEVKGFELYRIPLTFNRKPVRGSRFMPTTLRFRRVQDGAGVWCWSYPLKVRKQNPELN